ncbi:MAG: PEP-CTERM sorting domain-containing protein, partial [Roseateles sp.]
ASLALAATTLASAGPVSTLYLNSETSRRLYAIQGDSIKAQVQTYCNHCEAPIAVDGDIRTTGTSSYGMGGQYRLDLSKTGTTYAGPFAGTFNVLFYDGTTDGRYNYAIGRVGDVGHDSIYRFDRDWGRPEQLFALGGDGAYGKGVTYDPTNRSLWVAMQVTNDLGTRKVFRDLALDGSVISQFVVRDSDGYGLAMDYADGTLWTTRGTAEHLDQYSRSGQWLQTAVYDELAGQASTRGLEFDLAGFHSVPEPASLTLVMLGVLCACASSRRR